MSVKLIISLTSNNDALNFNAEIDDSEKEGDIEENLAQYLMAFCVKELGRILHKNNQEGS